MAHKVYMSEPRHEVTKSDVTFVVKRNNRKLGELRVSKGNLQWYTGNGRRPYQISWKLFDEIMKKGGEVV